jgi:hypothetical protein
MASRFLFSTELSLQFQFIQIVNLLIQAEKDAIVNY